MTLSNERRPDLHLTDEDGGGRNRSGHTRTTPVAAGSPAAAGPSPGSTVKRPRHIHEFMALGETKNSLADSKRLTWVDLTASLSPVLFINHTSESDQNAKFMASSNGTHPNLSYLVATKKIPPYTEILTSYMEHLDTESGAGSRSMTIPKKQRTQ